MAGLPFPRQAWLESSQHRIYITRSFTMSLSELTDFIAAGTPEPADAYFKDVFGGELF